MGASGMLILFISIGVLILGGIVAFNSLHEEVGASNNSEVVKQGETYRSIESPIFTVLIYVAVLIAVFALIKIFDVW